MLVAMHRSTVSHRMTEAIAGKIEWVLNDLAGAPGLQAAHLVRRPLPDGRDELILVELWATPAALLAWTDEAPERSPGSRAEILRGATMTAYEVIGSVLGATAPDGTDAILVSRVETVVIAIGDP